MWRVLHSFQGVSLAHCAKFELGVDAGVKGDEQLDCMVMWTEHILSRMKNLRVMRFQGSNSLLSIEPTWSIFVSRIVARLSSSVMEVQVAPNSHVVTLEVCRHLSALSLRLPDNIKNWKVISGLANSDICHIARTARQLATISTSVRYLAENAVVSFSYINPSRNQSMLEDLRYCACNIQKRLCLQFPQREWDIGSPSTTRPIILPFISVVLLRNYDPFNESCLSVLNRIAVPRCAGLRHISLSVRLRADVQRRTSKDVWKEFASQIERHPHLRNSQLFISTTSSPNAVIGYEVIRSLYPMITVYSTAPSPKWACSTPTDSGEVIYHYHSEHK